MPRPAVTREHFVMIGPITDEAAADTASRLRSAHITNGSPVTVVHTEYRSSDAPRTRFTAAEIDTLVRVAGLTWAGGHGGQVGAPDVTLAEARLAMRAWAAVTGEPEPSEEQLASVRQSD